MDSDASSLAARSRNIRHHVAPRSVRRTARPRRGFEADLEKVPTRAHLADPLLDPGKILASATLRLCYDLFAYFDTRDQPQPTPPTVYTLNRETHAADLPPNQESRYQHILRAALCWYFHRSAGGAGYRGGVLAAPSAGL